MPSFIKIGRPTGRGELAAGCGQSESQNRIDTSPDNKGRHWS